MQVREFFLLSSNKQFIYIIAKVESAASCRDPMFTSDKVKEVRKIIDDVLTKQDSALDGLLKAALINCYRNVFSWSNI